MTIPPRGIAFFEMVTGLSYGVDADFETMAATLMAQTQLSTFVSLATMLLVFFLQPPFAFFAVWRPVSPDRRPAYLTVVLMVLFSLRWVFHRLPAILESSMCRFEPLVSYSPAW
ncbi:MAG: hypothetical protein R2932_34770 [Caldilineaceae bacterium]